ncbi:MAG: Abi family protein [Malacoplasma sp.]|nr:Abi family protein [Malacoplasma sp.]
MFYKKNNYHKQTIDIKHNYWRIKNDLSWIVGYKENINDLVCLYWLDINLKNVLFPWVLKLEREIKSCFVYYYKEKFQSENSSFLKDANNYSITTNSIKLKVRSFIKRIKEVNNESDSSIDSVVFSLTFGEFINIFIYFSNEVKINVAKHLGLNSAIFANILKFLSILRNAIAHNKTIIKIRDEKNNQRFSLKSAFFDFDISKKEIDIISTNVSGSIYVIKKVLLTIDKKSKVKKLIKDVKRNLKTYKKSLGNKEMYQNTIGKIFLKYFNHIMRI